MARKIRGFWFRLCGFFLATFCTVGAGKTAYAECDTSKESEECCEKLESLKGRNDLNPNPYTKGYNCVKYRGGCYLQGQGPGNEATYLTDDAGKFYYKTDLQIVTRFYD